MMKYNKEYRQELKAVFKQLRYYIHKEDFRRMIISGYNNPNYLEVQHRGDEYREQVVYEINAYGYSVGFFAEFLYMLIRLYFASDRGFTPYVCWGKEFLYYEEDGVNEEYNAFLYYFKPVSDVLSTERASHVIESKYEHIHSVQDELDTHGYSVSDEYMICLSSMIKKYIRYNDKTKDYLEAGYNALIGDRKALAVHFRGTDYRRHYNNHPVFVTIEQEAEKVKELLATGKYDVIFLATDEQEAVELFRGEFGDKVKYFEDTWRADGGDESVAYSHADRPHHNYLLGLEVIRDQYMLTRCDGLVCGVSNLTLSARMMRKAWYEKDYEDLVILSQELYHNERRFCDAKH